LAVVADSGALYALYDRRDRNHKPVRAALSRNIGPIIIPSVILSEVDYLLRTRLGIAAEQRLLEGILSGAFAVENFLLEDAAYCRETLANYSDLDLGLADAAVAATADRLGIRAILTVDERDFRALRSRAGKPFILYPTDL
jgi:uncharacterized protein